MSKEADWGLFSRIFLVFSGCLCGVFWCLWGVLGCPWGVIGVSLWAFGVSLYVSRVSRGGGWGVL